MTAAAYENYNPAQLWLDVQRRLEGETSAHLFQRYVLPVRVDDYLSQQEGSLVLLCPSDGGRAWLADRLRGRIEALAAAAGLPGGSAVVYKVSDQPDLFFAEDNPAPAAVSEQPAPAADAAGADAVHKRTGLSQRYTFTRYCSGSNNELAVAAGRKLAAGEDGVAAASPLLVHGPVGVGKTHLAHAIGNHHLELQPGAQPRCVSAEQFMREVQRAFTGNGIRGFRRKYRGYSLLIIDDIQQLGPESKQTVAQLASLLSYRDEHGLPTVLTCDRELGALRDRLPRALLSRLEAGLAVRIGRPDLETRMAILRCQARALGTKTLGPAPARLLATGLRSNCRELIGALRRLLFEAEFRQTEPSAELAQRVVRDLGATPRRLNLRRIIEACADYFKVAVEALLSKSRAAGLVVARHVAMFLCRELTQESLPAIGRAFGCHHTSVLHATAKVAARLRQDAQLAAAVGELRQQLAG